MNNAIELIEGVWPTPRDFSVAYPLASDPYIERTNSIRVGEITESIALVVAPRELLYYVVAEVRRDSKSSISTASESFTSFQAALRQYEHEFDRLCRDAGIRRQKFPWQ